MGQEQQHAVVPANDPKGRLLAMLDGAGSAISAALPKHITPERMMRLARTAIQTTPGLLKCSPQSVIGSIVEASQLGLEPNGALGEGYLVPFFNKRTKQMECQFIPGYRGYITLARRSGQVQSISAHIVCERDAFEYELGLEEKLTHRPALGDRGKPTHGYAICRFKDGGHHFEVMPVEDIEKCRRSSSASDNGPWSTHWEEMARKTTIRRLAKYLPLSPELTRASMLDEYAEAGFRPGDVEALTAMQTDNLRDRLRAVAPPQLPPDVPEPRVIDVPFGGPDDDAEQSPEPTQADEAYDAPPTTELEPLTADESAVCFVTNGGRPSNWSKIAGDLYQKLLGALGDGHPCPDRVWFGLVKMQLDRVKAASLEAVSPNDRPQLAKGLETAIAQIGA